VDDVDGVASDDAIIFAEKLLSLLDTGRYTATYKFATLTALIDVCTESVDDAGRTPPTISAKAVGSKVLELLWQHSLPYRAGDDGWIFLRHSTQRNDLVEIITSTRRGLGLVNAGTTLDQARRHNDKAIAALERRVITTVIRMPLPKLQRFGGGTVAEDRFIYDYGWPDEVSESRIWAAGFDDSLLLRPGVGSWLVRLGAVLRPIIQQRWAAFVADRSRDVVESAMLDEFLFGASRIGLQRVRTPLLEIQSGRCFYCDKLSPVASTEVDHFIPWVRHPDNGLDNLVAAHRRCNNSKRDALPAADHLERWLRREGLDQLRPSWPSDRRRTIGAARATYLWLPERTRLWRSVDDYTPADPIELRSVFARSCQRTTPHRMGTTTIRQHIGSTTSLLKTPTSDADNASGD
jgi:hypothetical protein